MSNSAWNPRPRRARSTANSSDNGNRLLASLACASWDSATRSRHHGWRSVSDPGESASGSARRAAGRVGAAWHGNKKRRYRVPGRVPEQHSCGTAPLVDIFDLDEGAAWAKRLDAV